MIDRYLKYVLFANISSSMLANRQNKKAPHARDPSTTAFLLRRFSELP